MIKRKLVTEEITYNVCDFCNAEDSDTNVVGQCDFCDNDCCELCIIEVCVEGFDSTYVFDFCKECYEKHKDTIEKFKSIEERIVQCRKDIELVYKELKSERRWA